MFDDAEFDAAKETINILKHGLAFRDFRGFDEQIAVIPDDRADYSERRYRAFGRIAGKGYMVAFTMRGTIPRIISLRRCHEPEIARYE